MRNGGNPAESEAFRTMSYSPLKSFNDPRKSKNTNKRKDHIDSDRRECMSKSPADMNSITIEDSNKNNLKPIQPVYVV